MRDSYRTAPRGARDDAQRFGTETRDPRGMEQAPDRVVNVGREQETEMPAARHAQIELSRLAGKLAVERGNQRCPRVQSEQASLVGSTNGNE